MDKELQNYFYMDAYVAHMKSCKKHLYWFRAIMALVVVGVAISAMFWDVMFNVAMTLPIWAFAFWIQDQQIGNQTKDAYKSIIQCYLSTINDDDENEASIDMLTALALPTSMSTPSRSLVKAMGYSNYPAITNTKSIKAIIKLHYEENPTPANC